QSIDPKEFLETEYQKAMEWVGDGNRILSQLPEDSCKLLDIILAHSESAKAVLTVIITSLVHKRLNPSQDIRNHQTSIPNGYSGRRFDTQFITPFMKSKQFPAMAESGWLTRSLEQKIPYDNDYTGAIQPKELKTSFITILSDIQTGQDPVQYLEYLLQGLILNRNKNHIELARPQNLSIDKILEALNRHFFASYNSHGKSRLPVIAIYAAYQVLTTELKRFEGKVLLPIENHTTSDARTGRIGDIELHFNNRAFEAAEIKFEIPINSQMIQDAYAKFIKTPVERYYILSTKTVDESEQEKVNQEIAKIKNVHGCQMIVNGIIDSLSYYLRLMSNSSIFIEHYVDLLESDGVIKFEHKQKWNQIISEING
ncbi:MAG: DNA cytosine methyltransferase, partial [Candidatus Pacebacteria bacterium]|nr:DNA cytosine methyltransferase [Candidatus Paceibacterota bacterium]